MLNILDNKLPLARNRVPHATHYDLAGGRMRSFRAVFMAVVIAAAMIVAG
jgi:hypothetical protein